MRGALLRSGKSQTFTALGETGQPVYRAALQLREAIRRKNPMLVDHLAIPQSNEVGDQIDWYSGIEGDVVPWTSATEEERAPARAQLEVLKASLEELSARFLAADPTDRPGDKAIFGKLLKRVINFPDETFVYLVNGKPILTFWGFEHANADRNLEPLHCLYPHNEPAASLPTSAAPLLEAQAPTTVEAVEQRPWWRRWWWLLPLLLLLLLLLFGLRACAPSLGLPGLPGVTLPNLPDANLPDVSLGNGLQLNGPGTPGGEGVGNGPGLPGEPAATEAPPEQEQKPPTPQADQPEPAAEEPPASEAPPAEEQQTPAEPPQPQQLPEEPAEPAEPAEPLSIPEQAGNGPADFLNGDWRAGAGIQDRRTGKPLRLEYRFNDGKGEVTVRRPDGVTCSGPVAAAMNDGRLGIDSQGQAACADGSNYDMPQVTCAQGAQSIADCTGSYGNERFPMSMRRAGE